MTRSQNKSVGSADYTAASTAMILFGLFITAFVLPSDSAERVFTVAAVTVGLSLVVAGCIESLGDIRRLIRADILMLVALYGLTFLEFLAPQPNTDAQLSASTARSGTTAVLVGFAGIVIGRHFFAGRRSPKSSSYGDLKAANVFSLFLFVTIIGYAHILVAVNFDVIEMLREMALPRFSQSWGRGKFGDIYSLFYELGLLIYLVPPIAGLIFARSKQFGALQKVTVALVLALTFYHGFSSGTRSVMVSYALTFVGVYLLVKPGITMSRVLLITGTTALVMLVGTIFMLEFRNMGLDNYSFEGPSDRPFFVDGNLVIISRLTEAFPDVYDYLGFEIPFHALIRPIPRALWPGKPEGLSTGIEAALGVDQAMTLACTFVGEAYMSGGLVVVFVFALVFGAGASLWSGVVGGIRSPFSELLYASGFVCAAIGMRSVLSMGPVMLPTIALFLYGKFWLPRQVPQGIPPIRSTK